MYEGATILLIFSGLVIAFWLAIGGDDDPPSGTS